MRYCLECPANRYIFKSRLNCSESTAGSLRQSGNEFQTVGPATEKARVPKVPRRTRGTNSWWRLADHRCWQPGTSETKHKASLQIRSPSTFLFWEDGQPLEHVGSRHYINEGTRVNDFKTKLEKERSKKKGLFPDWSLLGIEAVLPMEATAGPVSQRDTFTDSQSTTQTESLG